MSRADHHGPDRLADSERDHHDLNQLAAVDDDHRDPDRLADGGRQPPRPQQPGAGTNSPTGGGLSKGHGLKNMGRASGGRHPEAERPTLRVGKVGLAVPAR
jgi:hypothetical protein